MQTSRKKQSALSRKPHMDEAVFVSLCRGGPDLCYAKSTTNKSEKEVRVLRVRLYEWKNGVNLTQKQNLQNMETFALKKPFTFPFFFSCV